MDNDVLKAAEEAELKILCKLKCQDEWHNKRDQMRELIHEVIAKHCIGKSKVRAWVEQFRQAPSSETKPVMLVAIEIMKEMHEAVLDAIDEEE